MTSYCTAVPNRCILSYEPHSYTLLSQRTRPSAPATFDSTTILLYGHYLHLEVLIHLDDLFLPSQLRSDTSRLPLRPDDLAVSLTLCTYSL